VGRDAAALARSAVSRYEVICGPAGTDVFYFRFRSARDLAQSVIQNREVVRRHPCIFARNSMFVDDGLFDSNAASFLPHFCERVTGRWVAPGVR
jgi:hypothetical protein